MLEDREVEQMVRMYETGRIDRRRLLQGLTAMMAGAGPAAAQSQATPAPSRGVLELSQKAALHHVEVKTIQSPAALTRTRDFYQKLFGVPAEVRKDRVVLTLPGGTYLSVGFAQDDSRYS